MAESPKASTTSFIRLISGTTPHHTSRGASYYDSGIFQTYNIPKPQHRSTRIYFQYQSCLYRQEQHPVSILEENTSCHAPKVETAKSYKPPISPDMSKGFAWLPLSLLSSTCVVAVVKREFAMLISYEVLPEGMVSGILSIMPNSAPINILQEVHRNFGVLCLQYKYSWHGKYGTRYHYATRGPCLYHHIFQQALYASTVSPCCDSCGIAASNTCPTLRPK